MRSGYCQHHVGKVSLVNAYSCKQDYHTHLVIAISIPVRGESTATFDNNNSTQSTHVSSVHCHMTMMLLVLQSVLFSTYTTEYTSWV